MVQSALQLPTLILNKVWHPIDSTTVKEAFSDVISGRATFLDPETYIPHNIYEWMNLEVPAGSLGIKTSNRQIRIPEIMLLSEYGRIPKRTVVFNRRNLWRRDGMRCFVPETLILMKDGSLRRIDSIQENDQILDSEGNVQTVEYVFSKHTNKDLVVLRHRGNGDSLTCTPNHRILVSDKKFNTRWMEAKDITIDDYLCELDLYSRNAAQHAVGSSSEKIDLSVIYSSMKHLKSSQRDILGESRDVVRDYNRKPVHQYLPIDEKLGRFIGYFLAKGNVNNNAVTFSFHIDEVEFAEDVQELVKLIFDIEIVSQKEYPDNDLRKVFCHSSIVAEFVRKWCFYDGEKRVHSKDFSISYLRGILYGILRGDANFNNIQFRTTLMMKTENLVRDIYLISHICGIKATLSKTGQRKDGRIYKSVIYNAQEFNKTVEICGLQKKSYTQDRKIDRLFNEGPRFISKVTSVSRMPYNGLVYDLQISGSHTYVADFVCVHNCQYCGIEPPYDEITVDHIIPKSKGGQTTFINCVLCCLKCNLKKANRTPQEAGMFLQRRKRLSNGKWITVQYEIPKRPVWNPLYALSRKTYPKSWAGFLKNFDEALYWEVELED